MVRCALARPPFPGGCFFLIAYHSFLLGIHSAVFVFKQAFSIPGSIVMNILFGAMYGTASATAHTCFLTAVGSLGAYGTARTCAPLVERFLPRALAITRNHLDSHTPSDLFTYLLLARFFPLLPYSVLNLVSGVLGLPIPSFFWTLVIGSFPYNLVTTQLGELLAHLAPGVTNGLSAIWSPSLVVRLVAVTVLSALPVIFKERLRALIASRHLARLVRRLYELMGMVGFGRSSSSSTVILGLGHVRGGDYGRLGRRMASVHDDVVPDPSGHYQHSHKALYVDHSNQGIDRRL
jgi:uncharacterized membrane protein YdjX (TVP38/TMEM64 family)